MGEKGVSLLAISFIALLCILIVISVFVSAYFGYLNVSGSVKGTADLENPFVITNWAAKTSIGEDGGIGFEIENRGFEPCLISSVEISECNSNSNDGKGWLIDSHQTVILLVKCTSENKLINREMIKKDITVYYRTSQGTIIQSAKGFIRTQVSE